MASSSDLELEVEVDKQQTTGSRLSTTNFELKEEKKSHSKIFSSSKLELPEELPSVEEALKLFAAISGLSGTVLGIFVGQKTGLKVNHGTLMKCVNFGN